MLASKSNFMTVKVHPQVVIPSASCYFISKQETYTIWMKSLVLGCKGCTVFDAKGQLVYRVDNYNCNFRDEVNLMDSKGKVLFTVPRKRFKLFRFWEGYRSTDKEIEMKRPGFQVRKTLRIPRGDSPCEVIVGLDENQPRHYKIHSWSSCKSACKLVDQFGGLVAELKRKKSAGGVDLGNDVLTLVVEPYFDHSLIMGVFVVYCLINCKM
ncbi:protein LURP-one-related 11-like [Juglans microcarpa x Juglans regia]|uniref:protein LURP-one-related 11-like n=1 Tax=Juglans microcarpa x Juglans regia TaxID=2249226 RepID=UPI001B7E5CB1|nr:protein LURP-one-related 11-like [Juglans microcarpa x Juglans regia]